MARQRRKLNRLIKAAGESEIVFAGEVEIQAADGDDKLATVQIVAYTGGIMSVPGFGQVVVDLAGMEIGDSVTLLADHTNRVNAIAGTGTPKIENGRLTVTGTISRSETGQAIVALSRDGIKLQASIGAAPRSNPRRIPKGTTVTANGQQLAGPFLLFAKSRLREVSFVPNGADPDTSVAIAATTGAIDMPPEFVEWLKANGFEDPEALNDQQRELLQASWEAAKVSPDDEASDSAASRTPDVDLDELAATIRARAAAEQNRVDSIGRLFRDNATFGALTVEHEGTQVGLQAHAIAQNWSAEQTELYGLRNSRPQAPAIHNGHGSSPDLQTMQGMMLLRAGVELDSKVFQSRGAYALRLPEWTRRNINEDGRQQIMEASHRFSDWPLIDICREACRIDGTQVSGRSRGEIIQAAFSGSALDDIFTTSVNAALLTAYTQSADTTQGWTSTVDVADFKTVERHRLGTGENLDLLPRGKMATHLERSDVKETYRIYRFAKQFAVDEQDIVDDRMNALSDTPAQMGAAAARVRPDLVYYIILANATLGADAVALFDASTHNNLQTSAALAAGTLKTAIKDIEVQQDNSVNLNLRASHLIVPSDLKHTALQLVNSATVIRVGDVEDEFGTENTLSSGEDISVVADARLTNGVTDPITGTTASGSATTWYMASRMGHTIEVAYLTGTGRAPSVRSKVLDGGTWGLSWDVKIDIGAKALDFRGLQKNTA